MAREREPSKAGCSSPGGIGASGSGRRQNCEKVGGRKHPIHGILRQAIALEPSTGFGSHTGDTHDIDTVDYYVITPLVIERIELPSIYQLSWIAGFEICIDGEGHGHRSFA